ncbi:MAG TPA: protein kinase [Gemmataceae bacterium]|nr:protein kinase [Gemmataceae bacterium]
MDTDRNLLFGVLALQADLLDSARFAEACSAWAARKEVPLADLLVERGWLSPEGRADVDKLLRRKLEKHGGDARAGLVEVTDDDVRRSLAGVDDEQVRQSLSPPTPPPLGHVLVTTTGYAPESRDRYTLSRLHATGGIGRVWLARDASLGRDVALKELRPERAAHPAAWARFLKEAQVTGQLEHPGIVPIYEVGRRPEDQAPFYTMRFVRGRTLTEHIASFHQGRARGEEGPLALRVLLGAFVGVCNAVAYANSRGVIHRDLKPENVVLGDFGEVIVLDWGLAARLLGQEEDDAAPLELPVEGEIGPTVQGQVLGTPAYMSPEQAEGRRDLLGPHTDVYGLGAILYQMLTGQTPFTGGDTAAVLRQVIYEKPARPRALVATVPAALEAVCLKALAKKTTERYARAKDLAGDVERWLADEPVLAFPEPWRDRARRWLKRRRTAVLTTVAAGAVALVALAISTALLGQANDAERRARGEAEHNAELAHQQQIVAETAQGKEQEARVVAEQSEKRTRENLYASKIGLAWEAWQAGQVVRARGFLRDVLPAAGEDDLRGFEWHFLWRQCHQGGLRRLRGHTGRVSGLAFAADGKALASGSQDGTLMLWETGTGRPVGVLAPDPEARDGELDVTWVKRGDKLHLERVGASGPAGMDGRLGAGDELVAISGAKGEMVPVVGLSAEEVRKLEVGPPGTPVVLQVRARVGLRPCTLIRRRSSSAAMGSQFTGAVLVAFDPAGKALASAMGTVVRLWDPQRREARHTLSDHSRDVTALAFSRDGKVLATGDNDGRIHLWDPLTGKRTGSLRSRQDGTKWLHALAFTPDGKAVLASSGDYLVLFDVEKKSQREAIFNAGKPIVSMAYLSDGRALALGRLGARDNVELWDAGALKRRAFLHGHTDWVRALAPTADGWTLATAGVDHTVRLWDPGAGRLRATLRGHGNTVETVACGPDSDLLASGDRDGVIILWDSAREMRGNALEIHSRAGVNDLVIGTDNRTLVGAAGGGRGDPNAAVEVWDLRSRQSHGLIHRPPAWVRDLDFSPDGKSLAVSFSPGTDTAVPGECKVYDVATGQVRLHLADFSAAAGVTFSADGAAVITGSGSFLHEAPGEVRFHDATTGRALRTFRPHQGRCGIRLVGDGKTLLTHGIQLRPGGGQAAVAWWDVKTGRRKGRLEGDFALLLSADLSRDGKVLGVVLGDYFHQEVPAAVKLLDAATGKELATLTGHKGLVGHIAFAPDGKTVGVPGWDGGIRFYEVPGGKALPSLPHQPGQVHGLAFSADGKRVSAGIMQKTDPPDGKPGLARVWELTTRKEIASFELPAGSTPLTVLSPDGRLMAAGNTKGGVRLWDLETGKARVLQAGEEHTPSALRSRSVSQLRLSPDGKTLATGGWDSKVTLWGLNSAAKDGQPGRVRKTILTGEVVSALAFTPDGKTLAFGTGGRTPVVWPGRLCLYDLTQGKVRSTLRVGAAGVSALTLLPDGHTLVAATDHFRVNRTPSELFLVDTATGKRGETIYRGSFYTRCLAVSPGGQHLAFEEGQGAIRLLNRKTGGVQTLRGHVHLLYQLAFAPDGKTLASASADGTVKLWHLATGRELISLVHEHWVEGLCFSPDGQTMASGSQANLRGIVRLWEAAPVTIQRETWYDPAEVGYARVVRTEDERGRLVEEKFLDAAGRPAAGPLGQARTVIDYGANGKEAGRSFFDSTGHPLRPETEAAK